MKNILNKNQVIITALAIMIAVAGYLNFTQENADKFTAVTQTEEDSIDTEEILDTSEIDGTVEGGDLATTKEETEDTLVDISAEDLGEDVTTVSDSGEIIMEEKDKDKDKDKDKNKKSKKSKKAESDETIGESVLVNNTINEDFFASAKISREQTRAKNKETLMELVDNINITDNQKEDAIKEVIELTAVAEKENATEILLEAKGFDGVVVTILEDSVDVIVNANNLTNQQIAQIEDIVKRKTEIAADKIVISPVGVKTSE